MFYINIIVYQMQQSPNLFKVLNKHDDMRQNNSDYRRF